MSVYDQALKYSNYQVATTYENIAQITLVYGNYVADQQLIVDYGPAHYPDDPTLWMDLVILDYEHGDDADAKVAIERAASYGQVPQFLYSGIVEDHRLIINFPGLDKTVEIPKSKMLY